jgi:hypothetical protein
MGEIMAGAIRRYKEREQRRASDSAPAGAGLVKAAPAEEKPTGAAGSSEPRLEVKA